MTDNQVIVTAVATFRGKAWEGQGGLVTPGTSFSCESARAAELRALGLVEDPSPTGSAADPAAAATAADPVAAAARKLSAKEKAR